MAEGFPITSRVKHNRWPHVPAQTPPPMNDVGISTRGRTEFAVNEQRLAKNYPCRNPSANEGVIRCGDSAYKQDSTHQYKCQAGNWKDNGQTSACSTKARVVPDPTGRVITGRGKTPVKIKTFPPQRTVLS